MKVIIISGLVLASFAHADQCKEETRSSDVAYEVNTKTPEYLRGAIITVTLKDGSKSEVPAEKFMVVPRIQKTVVGQNKVTSRTCGGPKNILVGEARKDIQELETSTSGSTATVSARKGVVPGVNYYRRNLFDSPIGAGIGIDTNGTPKALIGIEF